MSEHKKIIGYAHSGYPEKRNVYGHEVKGFIFKKQNLDMMKVLDHLYFKLYKKTNTTFHNLHFAWNKADLLHYFNGINLSNTAWVSTFETSLPRVNKLKNLALSRLQHSSCKKLIALSHNAKHIQVNYLSSVWQSTHDDIISKIIVLHPPQELLISSVEEKKHNDKLSFTLIGADFFRKGGMEVLEVFDSLLQKNYDIKLNIVSTLLYGDYASQTAKQDVEKAMKLIAKHPNNIFHYNKLPNNEVLNLLKESHIALLPTYADTYGYSVLEAQACGCLVITTNVRALPEINNNEVGYVIEVPKNELGNGILNTMQERQLFSEILKENLINIISKSVNNTAEIVKKGSLSIERIKNEHNPVEHSKKLWEIYNQALL